MNSKKVLTALVAAASAVGLTTRPASAQGAEELADQCVVTTAQPADWCKEMAVTTYALRAGLGFFDAGGSDIPGSSSTLGTKLGSIPRFSFALEPSIGRLRAPKATGPVRSSIDDQTLWITGVQGRLALSIFDGFSILPTVGGIFSVDVVGSASYLLLPGREFSGSTGTIGLGVRMGLLRESFTMPGVSVSIMHRALGKTTYGDRTRGDDAKIDLKMSTTSARVVVGKDLLVMGFFAGLGWDWHRGDATFTALNPGGFGIPIKDESTDKRATYFGGVSWSFLVFQLSLEGGWSEGTDDLSGRTGRFDASSHPWYAAAALRVTL